MGGMSTQMRFLVTVLIVACVVILLLSINSLLPRTEPSSPAPVQPSISASASASPSASA